MIKIIYLWRIILVIVPMLITWFAFGRIPALCIFIGLSLLLFREYESYDNSLPKIRISFNGDIINWDYEISRNSSTTIYRSPSPADAVDYYKVDLEAVVSTQIPKIMPDYIAGNYRANISIEDYSFPLQMRMKRDGKGRFIYRTVTSAYRDGKYWLIYLTITKYNPSRENHF